MLHIAEIQYQGMLNHSEKDVVALYSNTRQIHFSVQDKLQLFTSRFLYRFHYMQKYIQVLEHLCQKILLGT